MVITPVGNECRISVHSIAFPRFKMRTCSTPLFWTQHIFLSKFPLNFFFLLYRYGLVLLVVYFLFMILATLYELNVFGYVHPPECPSDL